MLFVTVAMIGVFVSFRQFQHVYDTCTTHSPLCSSVVVSCLSTIVHSIVYLVCYVMISIAVTAA
jgi:hypothetical protein